MSFPGKVLIIEDSRTFAKVMEFILGQHGARVSLAHDGAEALEAARESHELILLDLVLPDVDGFELLPKLRQLDPAAAVVVMTGAGGAGKATQAFSLGADGYIDKQYIRPEGDLSEFHVAIELAMENRRGKLAQAELETLKQDFYSMVTHDLRSPAAGAVMALKLYRSQSDNRLLVMLESSLQRLMSRVEKYLCFAKMDAGFMDLETRMVNLGGLVEGLVEEFKLHASEKNQTIERSAQEVRDIPVDVDRLTLAIENLLSNAIKYTPKGGTIWVELSQSDDFTELTVRDSGKGVPRDRLPGLFDRYYRVPGSNEHAPGTGLGLQIVKLVAEGHGGSVEVDSEGVSGSGTTFKIQLPNQMREALSS